jgi:GH24 family phage-related lysozyme (muramidase)
MAYEYNLKVIKIKTPTDANWVPTIVSPYMEIRGRVYDIKKFKDEEKTPDGIVINYGYYMASAELTELPNPFSNPITSVQVTESKIEAKFEDNNGWDKMVSEEIYFEYLAKSAAAALEEKYNELFGIKIKLDVRKKQALPATEEPNSATGSITTTAEISSGTASVAGPTASGTASVAGPSASNIDGEFIFNVEKEDRFIGNNQFGTLFIIGIGEIKQEQLEMPEEILSDEGLGEEYVEGGFAGEEEGAFVMPDQVVWPENRATSPEFKEEAPSNIPIETISSLPSWNMKLTRKAKGENWEAHAANYISLKEGFVGTATWDENHYRMGFGSDKILKGGKLTEVMKGDKCTLTEATETLSSYGIPNFSKTIAKAIGSPYWEKLNAYQKAALVSLGYNVGQYYITARGYGKRIKEAIVDGNMPKAAQEILNGPATASGRLLRPLKERRKEEAQLFMQPISKSIYK